MAPLDLRERLRGEIEMPEGQATLAGHGRASLAPPRRQREEVAGRSKLDVDSQLLLDRRQRAQQLVLLRVQFDVDVDRGGAPTDENGGRAAYQVANALRRRRRAKRAHEPSDSLRI